MSYDNWKQTDTQSDRDAAWSNAVEAKADSMVEDIGELKRLFADAFSTHPNDPASFIRSATDRHEQFAEELVRLLLMPKYRMDALSVTDQLALVRIRACLRDKLIANGTAAAAVVEDDKRAGDVS
jgi:hypothetical protein